MFQLICLYYWTWSSQCCTTGEPPCWSFILPAPGKVQLLLLRSHTVNMQHEELCEGCCNLRWLSPFFSLSGSSPAGRLLTMILLTPPVILTCHQALLLPSELWLMLISVRPRSKASATWHGDVLLFNWRCTKVKTEILFNPESFARDCSDVWSGSSAPPAWPEHHPAALMLLCGHAALSKHHRLVFLVKLLFGVLSDHGMLFHRRRRSDSHLRHETFILRYADTQRCDSVQDAVGQLATSPNTFQLALPSLWRELLHVMANYFYHL